MRPAAPEDAPAICDLLNAVDVVEPGRPETDLATVESSLVRPEADLERNSWPAFEDGALVACGLLWEESGAERIDVDHYVLPAHQEAGERLLDLLQDRAAERAAENGAGRAVVHLALNTAPTMDTARLARRGWRTLWRAHMLTRPLSAVADPVPALPPGLTPRDCTAEADRRRAHELLQESSAEHVDHQRRTYRQWLDDLGQGIDWSLVWIASLEGAGDVGAALTRDDRAAMAWIRSLGVREEARGRGGHRQPHGGPAAVHRARHDPPLRRGHLGTDAAGGHPGGVSAPRAPPAAPLGRRRGEAASVGRAGHGNPLPRSPVHARFTFRPPPREQGSLPSLGTRYTGT
ncbi:GNAT family N-acetyltransferase [Actinacidiphila glaucinigra]|uniref:GNAT family N-acetyltransferase n=1 Tax=Actinacidiphila glaucinigra TaxID=235986 RepID=UPI003AF3C9A1